MILVSGTKRSGTSMWMQVLAAAGLPVLGQAFPRGWDRTIREANPEGFFESILREGIYYRTNPHPTTGDYFLPEHVDGYAVKVFIPGVIRTERAYIGHLIANVREWREYEASIERLYAMELAHQRERDPEATAPEYFPPAYEWWMENFALVRDISLRRYPARLQAYDQVLDAPERVIRETLEWIGRGDVEAAVAAVKPEHRTQRRPESSAAIDPALARVFDDLYGAVAAGEGFSKALLATLNETNRRLLPQLVELQRRVIASQAARAREGGQQRRPEAIEGLPRER
ncbi:MAG: hypothetical protein H6711_22375 [Myxococcales bacterium]|nr:hypothetical protein [Myxococcales bacterium]